MELKSFVETHREDIPPIVQGVRSAAARATHVLYQPCQPITDEDHVLVPDFVKIMHRTMRHYYGIGIAANQVGVSRQVFIIEAQLAPDHPRYRDLQAVGLQVFINPRITAVSDQRNAFWHGCLSAEGERRGQVATYDWIEYECLDAQLKPQSGRLQGLGAIIFQHEFRHLLGGLYLDHATYLLTDDQLNQKIEDEDYDVFQADDKEAPLLLEGYQIGKPIA